MTTTANYTIVRILTHNTAVFGQMFEQRAIET